MVIPAILEKDFQKVKEKIALIENVASLVQIDIAEKTLVNGETFSEKSLLNSLETSTNIELDLMVTNPQEWIAAIQNPKIIKACANILSKENILEFIQITKTKGIKKGISINPATPLKDFEEFVPNIEFIQFMGVTPGMQGQSFENVVTEQIKEFKNKYPQIEIQVDGGITIELVPILKNFGISHFVVGSAIFKSSNPIEEFKKLENCPCLTE